MGFPADDENVDFASVVGTYCGEVWVRTLNYLPRNHYIRVEGAQYQLIVTDEGENINGGIFRDSTLVAKVEDGAIVNCTVAANPAFNRYFDRYYAGTTLSLGVNAGKNYFGKHLAELERIAQFIVSPRSPVNAQNSKECASPAHCAALRAAYVIDDSLLEESYYLDVDLASGNGSVVTSKAPYQQLASINHGVIAAISGYYAFDRLPWSY
jgi:hypothetical protein